MCSPPVDAHSAGPYERAISWRSRSYSSVSPCYFQGASIPLVYSSTVPRPTPEPVGDDSQMVTLALEAPSYPRRAQGDLRPAEHPALRLGASQSGVDALDDDRPLELGEHAEHLNVARPTGVAVSSPCWCR